jgi:hypothetical protein
VPFFIIFFHFSSVFCIFVNTLFLLSLFILFILFLFLFFVVKKKKSFACCMLGRRSLNLELIPLDPEIDNTHRRTRRAPFESDIRGEMGDQRENIPENLEQPIFENKDARVENVEQVRAWHVDFTTSLQD